MSLVPVSGRSQRYYRGGAAVRAGLSMCLAFTFALPAAFAQPATALTAEEAAELASILPIPPGVLRAQFSPPQLRVETTLEDASDYSSWQWAGSLNDPVNTATFRQDTRYRINVRTK